MLMKNCSIKIISFIFLAIPVTVMAQVKKPAVKKTSPQKPAVEAPLKVKALWGNVPGGNMLVADGIRYADSSLRVIDEKGNKYPVLSFRFIYKRKASITDDQTGAVKSTWDVVATDVYNDTSLSEVWRNTIKESLQRDEQWLIDYITIRDKSGKKIMTTPVTITFK